MSEPCGSPEARRKESRIEAAEVEHVGDPERAEPLA
jgi:hypothetical protein